MATTLVQAVRTRLLAIPAVAALVDARVYPVTIPASATLPAITVRRSGYDPEETIDGQGDNETRRVEVSMVAETYQGACDLADLVRGTYRVEGDEVDGLNGWTTATEPEIKSCVLVEETDDSYFDQALGTLGYIVKHEYELNVLVEQET